MIGLVLAAGAGRRLRPETDALPKALLPVDGPVTILDIALRNLAAVGLRDVTVVVGYAADAVRDRMATLEAEHGAPGWRAARLTVDLFRPAAMALVEIDVRPIRAGRHFTPADAADTDVHIAIARSAVFDLEVCVFRGGYGASAVTADIL